MRALRRLGLVVCLLVGAAASISSQGRTPNTLTFGLSPVTSTIVAHPAAPLPNPDRAAIDPNFSMWSGRSFATADMNGDGLIDIVITPTYLRFQPRLPMVIWLNQGGGRFADGTSEVIENGPIETGGAAPYVADFNRDGRNDIYIGQSGLEDHLPAQGFDGAHNILLLSQPNGRLRDVSSTMLVDNPVAYTHPSNMADLNGDGAMDLVLQRLGSPTLAALGTTLVFNDGTGKMTESIRGLPREIAYLPRAEASAVPDRQAAGTAAACDFDNNGRVDLVSASYTNAFYPRNVRMFQQSADGQFTEKFRIPIPPEIVQIAAGRTSQNVGAAGIVCQDLDGDNLGDVVVHWETDNGAAYIQFLHNTGGFHFEDVTLDWFGSWESNYPVRNTTRSIMGLTFRDINGDGTPDFVPKTQGSLEPTHLWDGGFAYLNDGTGHLTKFAYRGTNPSVTAADLARSIGCPSFCSLRPLLFDATGDGLTDLVLIDTWTLRSADAPIREDRVLVHTLTGQHDR